MPNYQRPQIPYNPPEVLPFSDRYGLTAQQNQPIYAAQLDGDINYLVASLNALRTIVDGIAAGILPGANNPINVNKFPITDGAGNISWSQITAAYFAVNSILTGALQDGCVTNPKLGNGSVGNDKIQAGAIQNNNINDDAISFDKITNAANNHFQEFFNNQADGALSGAKISAGSLPAAAIAANSLPGTVITDNTLPAAKIVNDGITRAQLAPVIKLPFGLIMDWAGDAATVAANCPGWLLCNGQSIATATYPGLFAVIGYTYGGAGANFNVPDLRGRTTHGVDTTSGQPTGNRIAGNPPLQPGSAGGAENHTLTIAQMPSHTHDYTTSAISLAGGGAGNFYVAVEAATTGARGSDQPHNNMSPYMLVNKIIYAGV